MIDAVIEELKTHQTQLDQDGVMVGVSRQALEELLAHVAAPAQPAPIAGLEPVASVEGAFLAKAQDLVARNYTGIADQHLANMSIFYIIAERRDLSNKIAAFAAAYAAEQVRPLVEALEGLIEAVELDADEGLEGIGSYTGARLTDAKNAIRARGQS